MIRNLVITILIAINSCTSQARANCNLPAEAKKSTVFLTAPSVDQETGSVTDIIGTGFVISKSGYVMSSYHVIEKWLKNSKEEKSKLKITGVIGGEHSGKKYPLEPVDYNTNTDILILKLPDIDRDLTTVRICQAKAAKLGTKVLGFGFPLGKGFQPVGGIIGAGVGPGGTHLLSAPFTDGMSGGPVYDLDGFVVGIINGGIKGDSAVSWITPISHAIPTARAAGDFNYQCKIDQCKGNVVLRKRGDSISKMYSLMKGKDGNLQFRLSEAKRVEEQLPSSALCAELGKRHEKELLRRGGPGAKFWVRNKPGDVVFCQKGMSKWLVDSLNRDFHYGYIFEQSKKN